jgi:hypothetical protein
MFSTIFKEPTTMTYDKDFSVLPMKSYSFSKHLMFVPLLQNELSRAAFDYPVLIAKVEEDIFPVALLSLKENENLLVNGKGAWEKEFHIPSFLKTYPFILTKPEWNMESRVMYDKAYYGINKKDTDSIEIINSGKLTQIGKRIMDKLQEHYVNFEKTKQIFTIVENMGLLKEAEVKMVGKDQNVNYLLKGFYEIDTEKLNNLDDEKLLMLAKNGILSLIHFHLASFANMQKLINRL